MKLSPLVPVLLSFLFFSCSKSLDNPAETETTTTLKTQRLVRNLDSTVLTVTLVRVITCYSYANGASPRPCNVFVEISCLLSRPIAGSISVQLERPGKTNAPVTATVPERIGVYMAPNTRQFSLRKLLTDNSYAPDMYSIANVSVFNMLH